MTDLHTGNDIEEHSALTPEEEIYGTVPLTSEQVSAAFNNAVKKAHSAENRTKKLLLPNTLPPHDSIDRDEFQRWESRIAAPNRGIISTTDFSEPDEIFLELVHRIRRYHPNADISMIEQAFRFAEKEHGDQKRKSGEPYIIHPLCVALILADLEMDKETIAAGLLHDTVEDTATTLEDVAHEFSPEVSALVDGVTKLGLLAYDHDKVTAQAENLRKMFLAMSKDIRVIIIKLADRLHNMRTLKYMSPEKQKEKARETQEIYAPIATRLGISKMKVELDDLALKYLEPDSYYSLVEAIALQEKERDGYVDSLVEAVRNGIRDAGIEAEIEGRAKHLFSIYKKMVNQNKTLDQIYDLFAIRIIVNDVKDCYAALGVMHEMYTPIPGRFKDYIAMPKPNMYQSLHTTLIGPDGAPFEIQIRTWDMHKTAEYGIAAHWKYKESGEGATVSGEEKKLSWLRQILEWQQDMSDDKEFMNLLKSDLNLFSDTVYCFTPQGEIKNLPKGSTPIDFAYSVHSAVGNRMIGAKVNGRLVPIDYSIENGDRIEILTSQNSKGPSRDWLLSVASTQAKNKINQWFRNQSKEDNIARGKELLITYSKSKNIDIGILSNSNYQASAMQKFGYRDWNSLLAAVGQNSLKEGSVVNRMFGEYLKEHPQKVTDADILEEHKDIAGKLMRVSRSGSSGNGIIVNGVDDVSVRFSHCCNPLPGDEIVGFITRGRGVSIHRTDCINIINLPEMEKERLIEAEWKSDMLMSDKKGLFATSLQIFGRNRTGLLVDISKVFTEKNIDIQSMTSRASKTGIATIEVTFGAKDRDEVESLSQKLRQIESVVDIERSAG